MSAPRDDHHIALHLEISTYTVAYERFSARSTQSRIAARAYIFAHQTQGPPSEDAPGSCITRVPGITSDKVCKDEHATDHTNVILVSKNQ